MQRLMPCPLCRLFWCMSVGCFIVIMLLAEISFVSVVHAATGSPSFSLQPVLFDATNPITKAYFVFNVKPSASAQNSVRLINIGRARGTVDLYAVDTTTSQYSGVSYFDRKKPHVDVAAWIKLSLQSVTLAPQQHKDILFHLTLPRNARVGQHVGGIVAENVVPQNVVTGRLKGVLTLKKLTIIPVVVNVSGNRVETMTTTGAKFDSANSFQRLLIPLSNTGNMLLHPFGTLTITDVKGHVVQKNTLNLDALLPQTTIQYPINIRKKAFPVGKYKARLQLTYGKYTKRSVDITTSFTIAKAGKALVTMVANAVPPQPDNSIFSQLAPWHYIVAVIALLLTGSALFFWVQKLFVLVVGFQHKDKYRNLQKRRR